MSAIYNQEPQPTASAIIHTTQGEISVELFAKQTPLTCRNFLQLSLDGFYDNTIFHRLIPGFILQGGDPTGTGHGGESIYDGGALSGDLDPWPMDERRGNNAGPSGVNFKDEFHSRLKFNRRGLLGMANEGVPNSNGSQFFFTLGKAEELTNKNTVFGRVAGDTIYNLMKMGEAEVEEGGERPLYPVKITHVEVLINPFDGMEKRDRKARAQVPKSLPAEKKQKKRKGGKQLLSFGDDEGDEDEAPVVKKAKFDKRIVMDLEEETSPPKEKSAKSSAKKKASKDTSAHQEKQAVQAPRSPSPPPPSRTQEPPKPPNPPRRAVEVESSPELEKAPKKKSLLERTNDEIAAVKASMKRTVTRAEPVKQQKKSAFDQLIPENSVRGRKARSGPSSTITKDDQEALDFLNAFKSKLEQAPLEKAGDAGTSTAHNQETDGKGKGKEVESEATDEVCDLHFIANCQSCQAWDKLDSKDESDDEGWMGHTLNCAADKLGKDLTYRKKAEEELVVIDPLAKAQTLKEQHRAARDARAGGSGREWDKKRNAR